ncbi:MAG: hypothetical protein LBM23_03875 [Propionibacteriaceae bacterium]|jgi:membrane protein implicated in regulation of membrane protease activity|nr:hypothetical protein [Propionibacteriaceae bacterium]
MTENLTDWLGDHPLWLWLIFALLWMACYLVKPRSAFLGVALGAMGAGALGLVQPTEILGQILVFAGISLVAAVGLTWLERRSASPRRP